ncbi:Serine/threonine-protein kinase [Punctularia strigosozonata HHB-11173 SS5]|uniref:Serine/threonine-protein kinase n=1 Tax=Punctularia strigosozonata (strain HHB-11173) TaxID=741275 RepID=UPI000441717F|nr:Serine/threonine-protein kinase [Punctularia strigosozonata HHB-11173 SS5]EIN05395.1 Serine/threonine-protein kinase [Punctularia strigosozonata HHB-11173 SS5]
MATNAELQEQEIEVLKSIFTENFIECPPPTVWKGATSVKEFIIRINHPDPKHQRKVNCQLHVRLPKTYPHNASPQFTIQQPQGLSSTQVTKLTHVINTAVQKSRGSEAVIFDICNLVEDWIVNNATPMPDAPDLATQMNKRASDEQRAKREREQAEAERELERKAMNALAVNAELEAEKAERQKQQSQQERTMARSRAFSDATAVPSEPASDTPTLVFDEYVAVDGVKFNSVRLFHPRQEGLGTTYFAEPVCDEATANVLLEVHIVNFESSYYSTSPGRKKLRNLVDEIKRLIRFEHPHVQRVYACKLTMPNAAMASRLAVLSEKRPNMSLLDVLGDNDTLKEEKATMYLKQILKGLRALHEAELLHRGVSLECVFLGQHERATGTRIVKLGRAGWPVRITDLHRSNPISDGVPLPAEELPLPEGWLSQELVESPLEHKKITDVYYTGVLLLQMLMGREVVTKYPTPYVALQYSDISQPLQRFITKTLGMPSYSRAPCDTLLSELVEVGIQRSLSPVVTTSTPTATPPMAIAGAGPRTPQPAMFSGSPVHDYFPAAVQRYSRYKNDFEELEIIGKGGFGSVVKVRHRVDNKIYAVKKIKLRPGQSTGKINREVEALSQLTHPYIVRYYNSWVGEPEPERFPNPNSDEESYGDDTTADGITSVQASRSNSNQTPSTFDSSGSDFLKPNLDDLTSRTASGSNYTFPTILFARSSSGGNSANGSSDEEDDDEPGEDELNLGIDDDLLAPNGPGNSWALAHRRPQPEPPRMMFIHMEFIERQTLRERIEEGLDEKECWRLFNQIVEALVHMYSHGIAHRDIKCANIFIDAKGDCKVGDFGLATMSSVAAGPSGLSAKAAVTQNEMTLEVGTRLYIAPEVLCPSGGRRDWTKVDMYSLGIVFFEMNHPFSTQTERVKVIESIRKPEIEFPDTWDGKRTRQHDIIKWLLQHKPSDRPSAVELTQSSLYPSFLGDEQVKTAMKKIVTPDSPHLQVLLAALFDMPAKRARGYLYDSDVELPEQTTLDGVVEERLIDIFKLHGAIHGEPALLLPRMNTEDESKRAVFLDKQGEAVYLPDDMIVPFARLAARAGHKRIKRYHIGDVFKPDTLPVHPKTSKAAVFDIITPDTVLGPAVAIAEAITVVYETLESFPGLATSYDIHISHSMIIDATLNRVPANLRESVVEILMQLRSTAPQKRALLLKKGLPRSTADELEVMSEADTDVDSVLAKLGRISPTLTKLITPMAEDIRSVLSYVALAGVPVNIYFRPLMLSDHHRKTFRNGVCFEVIKRNKRTDVLAIGGRYDTLISTFTPPNPDAPATYACAVEISFEKITAALAIYQNATVKNLIRDQRSFGFWSPRRCDVYVVSFTPGHMQDRLEVAALLWRHNISADVMYESGVADAENHVAQCLEEGILFIVYPRARMANKRDVPAFKVKSVLKGTEYDLSKHELVEWLQEQIAEQKRIDATTSGVMKNFDAPASGVASKEPTASKPDVQLLLPMEVKKQRKTTKHMFTERAFDVATEVKTSIQNGITTLAVDVPSSVFDIMTRNAAWLTDEDVWRSLLAAFPIPQPGYAQQVRQAALNRKADGQRYLLLVSVRDERVGLLTLG